MLWKGSIIETTNENWNKNFCGLLKYYNSAIMQENIIGKISFSFVSVVDSCNRDYNRERKWNWSEMFGEILKYYSSDKIATASERKDCECGWWVWNCWNRKDRNDIQKRWWIATTGFVHELLRYYERYNEAATCGRNKRWVERVELLKWDRFVVESRKRKWSSVIRARVIEAK